MDELEEIRLKKLAKLQRLYEKQQQEKNDFSEKILELEKLVKQYFTKEALERYSNIKVAHPELAVKILLIIGQAIQNGEKISLIDDKGLKSLLLKLQPKRKFKIIRK